MIIKLSNSHRHFRKRRKKKLLLVVTCMCKWSSFNLSIEQQVTDDGDKNMDDTRCDYRYSPKTEIHRLNGLKRRHHCPAEGVRSIFVQCICSFFPSMRCLRKHKKCEKKTQNFDMLSGEWSFLLKLWMMVFLGFE